MKEKHYITECPELYSEWDFEKNKTINIDPTDFVVGSAKKVWWKCSKCSNSWIASIRSRAIRGTNCPKCALIEQGENKRKTSALKNGSISNEKLLLEWDYSKNKDLPENFSSSSNKKVWWKCSKCGYQWEAKIVNRKNGRNCPCCSNKVVVEGVNDLSTVNKNLANEWHPTKNGELKPTNVTIGAGKKVWWICPIGHEYEASVMHRGHGTGCPICNSGRQTSFSEQALFFYAKKIFQDAINRYKFDSEEKFEVDIYIPSISLAIEYDGEFWHKKEKARKIETRKYYSLKKNGIRLWRIREDFSQKDILTIQTFSAGAVRYSEILAEQIFYFNPGNKYENLDFLIRSVLEVVNPKTNPWLMRTFPKKSDFIDVDTKRDIFEIKKYINPLKSSFADEFPAIAEEWHPLKNKNLTPNMFTKGSDFKAWWKCKTCGYEWQTSISHRVSGTGCKECYLENNRKNHYLAKKVLQYSLDGELLKTWDSVASASRELKINHSNISMCAKHQRKKAGGFVWKYLDEQ